MIQNILLIAAVLIGFSSCRKNDDDSGKNISTDGATKLTDPNAMKFSGIYQVVAAKKNSNDCSSVPEDDKMPDSAFRKYRVDKDFKHGPDGGVLLNTLDEDFCKSEEDCKKSGAWFGAATYFANSEWRGYNTIQFCWMKKASTAVSIYRLTESGVTARHEVWSIDVDNCDNYQEKMYEKRMQLSCQSYHELQMKRIGDLPATERPMNESANLVTKNAPHVETQDAIINLIKNRDN